MSAEIATAMSSGSDSEMEQPTKKELALWPGQELVRAQHGGFFPKRQAPCCCIIYKSMNVSGICSQQRMQRGSREQGPPNQSGIYMMLFVIGGPF